MTARDQLEILKAELRVESQRTGIPVRVLQSLRLAQNDLIFSKDDIARRALVHLEAALR